MKSYEKLFAVTIASICGAICSVNAQPSGPIAIGGFDASRGGTVSFAEGDLTRNMREAVLCVFPGATVSGTPSLSSAYLHTLDVIILASTSGAGSAISPLSPAEQDALTEYAIQGGVVLVFVDNDSFGGSPASSIANQSLIEPFGVHVTGFVSQFPAPVTVNSPGASNVTSGFFGTVSDFNMYLGGWFDSVASPVGILGRLDTMTHRGQPVLLEIAPGALGTGSGGVVMFADASILFNQFFFDEHRVLIANAINLAPRICYADCDTATGIGVLDIFDFLCFQNAFVAGECYADCDRSSGAGTFDIFDFLCFQNAFVGGCP